MELRYRREAAVGLLLLVAAAVFVALLMWLRGQTLRQGELVRATFGDVAGLKGGDPVRTSGVVVGRVQRVVLEEPGRVSVYFELHDAPPPRVDARASVRALDLFGLRYVEYAPGTASERLDALRPIRGTRELDLVETAQGLSGEGREVLANAAEFLSPATSSELRAVLVEARRTVARVGAAAEGPSRELTNALISLRQVFHRVDLLLGSAGTTQAMTNVRDATLSLARMTATLERTSVKLDSLMAKISNGRGSLGRMVNDSTLAVDLHNTSVALTELLNDIRANPGRYFRLRL